MSLWKALIKLHSLQSLKQLLNSSSWACIGTKNFLSKECHQALKLGVGTLFIFLVLILKILNSKFKCAFCSKDLPPFNAENLPWTTSWSRLSVEVIAVITLPVSQPVCWTSSQKGKEKTPKCRLILNGIVQWLPFVIFKDKRHYFVF